MAKVNANKLGLTVGIFAAVFHATWAILIAIGILQTWLNWILPMHFVSNFFTLLPFSISNALILIVCAFIGGYITGWVFAVLWNWVEKK
jgi:hypothetical protein